MNKTAFTLLFLFPSFLFSADWPNWLGPTHDGVSPESDFGNDLDNLQWKSKVGVGFSSMVVADGRLFTMGHDGQKGGKETVIALMLNRQTTLERFYEALWPIIYTKAVHATPRSMGMRFIP